MHYIVAIPRTNHKPPNHINTKSKYTVILQLFYFNKKWQPKINKINRNGQQCTIAYNRCLTNFVYLLHCSFIVFGMLLRLFPLSVPQKSHTLTLVSVWNIPTKYISAINPISLSHKHQG